MHSLLFQINETANDVVVENAIIDKNIDFLTEYLSMTGKQLNEAVTTWLAKVRNVISNGDFDPSKKESVVKILGALSAITNPDLASALDDKGDLGTILYNAGDKDPAKSNQALQRLVAIGNHPSVKSFTSQAAKAVEDPQMIDTFTKQIQSKIEPILNKKLGMERNANL